MMQTAQALHTFFSAFDIPAYLGSTEPDGASPPYLTYELVEPYWDGKAAFHASLWYRDTSLTAITAKTDEIKDALGPRGVSIKTDSGAVYLWADDNNWVQIKSMPGDPTLKRALLSLIIQAPTN